MKLTPGELRHILFGYSLSGADKGRASSAAFLYHDGTLTYEYGSREAHNERKITFQVSQQCLQSMKKIISENAEPLGSVREKINGSASVESENCFIFDGMLIIDWDLTRWYLEEDRKKHPEYYSNSVKVALTENYVRDIFDEICLMIEKDDKQMKYARTVLTDL